MLTKEQQMEDKIWLESDLQKVNAERYDNDYADVLIVDSPFGKQYFRWLEIQNRIKDIKIIRRVD